MGDIVSVIDMPPKVLSTWWRGKHGFQVGSKEFGVENSKIVFSFSNISVYNMCWQWTLSSEILSAVIKKNVDDVRRGFPFRVTVVVVLISFFFPVWWCSQSVSRITCLVATSRLSGLCFCLAFHRGLKSWITYVFSLELSQFDQYFFNAL